MVILHVHLVLYREVGQPCVYLQDTDLMSRYNAVSMHVFFVLVVIGSHVFFVCLFAFVNTVLCSLFTHCCNRE